MYHLSLPSLLLVFKTWYLSNLLYLWNSFIGLPLWNGAHFFFLNGENMGVKLFFRLYLCQDRTVNWGVFSLSLSGVFFFPPFTYCLRFLNLCHFVNNNKIYARFLKKEKLFWLDKCSIFVSASNSTQITPHLELKAQIAWHATSKPF